MLKKVSKFYSWIGSVLAIVFVLFGFSVAFEVPAYDEYVTDLSDVISSEQEEVLEQYIYQIWQETDVEIAVLFVDTIDGEDIWYAGYQVASEWGVGDAEKDNGLLFLIAVDDRQWTIRVAYGLEGVITDSVAKRIGENNFPAYFREGNYASGVQMALQDMEGYILADPEIMDSYDGSNYEDDYDWKTQERISNWATVLGFLYFMFGTAILSIVSVDTKTKKMKKNGRRYFFGLAFVFGLILYWVSRSIILSTIEPLAVLSFALLILTSDGSSSGGSSYSGSSRSYSSGSSWSSSSGGSFGGFGGGSFGGGGASGSW